MWIGILMDLVVMGVLVGVFGTVAMDLLNSLFARSDLIVKIDMATIGRMSAG